MTVEHHPLCDKKPERSIRVVTSFNPQLYVEIEGLAEDEHPTQEQLDALAQELLKRLETEMPHIRIIAPDGWSLE